LGQRKADGSLPDVGFLKLKKGSRAIDKGENLGFPFAGKAPDLGAFEYGLSSSSAASSSSTTSSSSTATSSSGTVSIMPQKTLGNARSNNLKGYHDLNGRHYEKQIRYHVMF
jgi:hypothetical protein